MSPHTKWLVTSRNRPEIEEVLSIDEPEIKLSLEITANAEQVAKSVDAFIDFKISKLPALKNDQDKKCKVQNLMRERASGTFLWVALVVGVLEKAKPWNILDKLKGVPTGLNEIYDSIMDQVKAQDDWEYCRAILAVVTLTYRPLHITELGILCKLPSEILSDEGNMRDLIGLCGSFLTLQEHGFVYLIHQSAKDYLSDTAVDKVFTTGFADAHCNILHMSIQGMQGILRQDMYNLRQPGVLTEDIITPNPDPLLSIRYSCVSWIGHFCDSYHASNPHGKKVLTTLVYDFIRQYYLYWLEALVLVRHVGDGLIAITKLRSLLKEQQLDQQLIELVNDCYRFNRQHHWVIESAPLQIYSSALIFSPTESLLRNLFDKEVPDWVMRQPTGDKVWSSCQQIIKFPYVADDFFGSVLCMDLSSDFRFLAAGYFSGSIAIREAATGILLRVIKEGDEPTFSVAFFSDSKFLASSYYDTIRIWEVETGTIYRTLKVYSGHAIHLASSPDSKFLASCSPVTTIKIWEVETGTLYRTLEGDSVTSSVAYSPDSKFLASSSIDRGVKIWEAETGILCRTLDGAGDTLSVAYSPDCKLLASGSRNGTMRVWEAATGILKWEIEGHDGIVNSVAFSLDSMLLASGSEDETVKIWDLRTRTLRQTFSACAGSVSTVAFYDNTGLLVSGFGDGTVRLWDVAEETLQEEPERHKGSIGELVFSPDSMFLAATFDSGDNVNIEVREAETGTRYCTLEASNVAPSFMGFHVDPKLLAAEFSPQEHHAWEVVTGALQHRLEAGCFMHASVAFSPDSKFICQGCTDGVIKIWEVGTGVLHRRLRSPSNDVERWIHVAFSPDSKILASSHDEGCVIIWDAATGHLQHTLRYDYRLRATMAFSMDSKYLAANCPDGMMRVWDTKTGDLQFAMDTGRRRHHCMALSPDFRLLALSSRHGSVIEVWDLATRTLQQSFEAGDDLVESIISTPGLGPNETTHCSFYIRLVDDPWIYCNGERLLMLPFDHEVSVSAISYATLPSMAPTVKIALGLKSGQIIIIGLRASGPYGSK